MSATCKKATNGQWFAIIVTSGNGISNIWTLRGPFTTKKCAQAESRKQKRRLGKKTVVDVVRSDQVSTYLAARKKIIE